MDWRQRLRRPQSASFVLLSYGLLAIAFTWPLARHLSSVVPHDLGDPLTYMWIFWWNERVTPLTAKTGAFTHIVINPTGDAGAGFFFGLEK